MASGRKRIRYRPVKKQKKESGALRYSPVYTGCPAVELAIQRLYQADDSQRENRFWALIKGLNYALEVQTQVLVPVQLSPGGPRGQFSWAQDPIPPEKSKGLAYWVLITPKGQKMLPVFTRPEEADGNPATLGLPMAQLPLQQVMEETLGREDLTGLVVNPWGRSAALDKSILRGLLYAGGTDDTPGEAETRQGRLLAYQGRWEEAEPLFAAAAAANYPEGIRRLADCYDAGHGIPRDRRKALSLWKKAAAQGDVLAQIALGDRYGAGTARTPGDPGRAPAGRWSACGWPRPRPGAPTRTRWPGCWPRLFTACPSWPGRNRTRQWSGSSTPPSMRCAATSGKPTPVQLACRK